MDDHDHDRDAIARLTTHEAICTERHAAVTRQLGEMRGAQQKLFDITDRVGNTLAGIGGKVAIIEAVMLALLALGIYEVLIRPVFQ